MYNDKLLFMIMIKINLHNTLALNVHVTLTTDWGTFYNERQICIQYLQRITVNVSFSSLAEYYVSLY